MPNKYLFLLDIEKEGRDGAPMRSVLLSPHAYNKDHAMHVCKWLINEGMIEFQDMGNGASSSFIITDFGSMMLRAMERAGKTNDDDE